MRRLFYFFRSSFSIVFYSIILGITVAVIAELFELSFRELAYFWNYNNVLYSYVPNWLKIIIGLLLVCPILYYAIKKIPEKRQHSPADLITGIHVNDGTIDTKSSLLTVIASIFSIGAGFSVGYYGPTVQLGAGAGFLFHKIPLIKPKHHYISIGAGIAAAIAAIFHSPIGAVVFVHEVLFRFFSIRAFAPITIAAVTSYVISSKFFNKTVFFYINNHFVNDIRIYFIASLSGIISAIVGVFIIKATMKIQQYNKKYNIEVMQRLLIAATITAIIIVLLPDVAGSNFSSTQNIINGNNFTIVMLFFIFISKLIASIVAFGFGVPGGIFGPTLFIGATLGAFITSCISLIFPGALDIQDIIVITTMAAMISSVIGAPVAMILITVEITGDFQIISVVMLAVVMANITVYQLINSNSFFDVQMKLRGFNFELAPGQLYAENHNINNLISDNFLKLTVQTSILEAEKHLLNEKKEIAFVVDDYNNLVGKLNIFDIRYFLRESNSADSTDNTVMSVTKTDIKSIYRATSIWQALQDMTDQKLITLPVIDGENNPKLLGVVYNNTLINEYFSFIKNIQNQKM